MGKVEAHCFELKFCLKKNRSVLLGAQILPLLWCATAVAQQQK